MREGSGCRDAQVVGVPLLCLRGGEVEPAKCAGHMLGDFGEGSVGSQHSQRHPLRVDEFDGELRAFGQVEFDRGGCIKVTLWRQSP